MELKNELLACAVADLITKRLDFQDIDFSSMADSIAIDILSEIQKTIQNDTLSDFEAIEKIVVVFEKHGIDSGSRHDF